MDKSFIDFMSDRLSAAKTSHQKWPDQILFEFRTDVGLAMTSIRTPGDLTVCNVGIDQPVSPERVGDTAELINPINMEFGPGSITANFVEGMIVCRTCVPFGLIRNDDQVASLLLGSTVAGVTGAVRAVRDVLNGKSVDEAMHGWRNRPMPAYFVLPENLAG